MSHDHGKEIRINDGAQNKDELRSMVADARDQAREVIARLTLPSGPPVNRRQEALRRRSGTPREFADRLPDVIGEISPIEAYDAIARYTDEWNQAVGDGQDIHEWFELSYAEYLTIPRSVLQSMPLHWQLLFVDLLNQLEGTINWRPEEGCYRVELREVKANDKWGRKLDDPLQDYARGRRRVPYKQHPRLKEDVWFSVPSPSSP